MVLLLAASSAAEEHPPSFARDVMAVLAKAGCNMGACHGNQAGKGGFRLSLRGEDAEFDYHSLVRGEGGRRLDPLDPAASLLLLKPTGRLAHQGGVRFARDSREYELLRAWIAAGMPADYERPRVARLHIEPPDATLEAPVADIQLQVEAEFVDGTRSDVTPLAVYESAVGAIELSPEGRVTRLGPGEATLVVRYLNGQAAVRLAFVDPVPGFVAGRERPANFVDTWIDQKLDRLRIPSSPPCDDGTFVRRAYVDAIGLLPTAEEARAFCQDASPQKRARLIEHLLARPEFADHWALKWSDLLRNEEKVLDTQGVDAFYTWIREAMQQGLPLDEFVRQLLTARGSTYEVPAANYYRANRDPTTRSETTAQVFLGLRLQCARCHNHPFDHWTQDDYYAWGSCFEGIDYEIVKNDRRDKFDKHEFVGEQIVKVSNQGLLKNPRTGEEVGPRLLGAADKLPPDGDRLELLAAWLTSPDNPWFARVMSNLVWYHVMGRGLVDPLDDFRVTNPATHPELLDELARELVTHDFDLRHLVRTIMVSQAYQRDPLPVAGQSETDVDYARAVVRRLTAEQLLDAQSQVLDQPAEFSGYPAGTRAGQVRGVRRARERDARSTAADRFLRTFGKPERLLACECERSNETSLKQVFNLVGGDLQERLGQDGNRISSWLDRDASLEEALDELYWTALSRAPTPAEREACQLVLNSESDRRVAWEDIVWAVLNSKEFLFRH